MIHTPVTAELNYKDPLMQCFLDERFIPELRKTRRDLGAAAFARDLSTIG